MVFNEETIRTISGIGEFTTSDEIIGEGVNAEEIKVYKVDAISPADKADSIDYVDEGPRAFLIIRKNTIEVRTDATLRNLLKDKYESVMDSRYFGRGGIEIVNSGQLTDEETIDLIRLSYDLSKD